MHFHGGIWKLQIGLRLQLFLRRQLIQSGFRALRAPSSGRLDGVEVIGVNFQAEDAGWH
jgi:Holliday junction resolvase